MKNKLLLISIFTFGLMFFSCTSTSVTDKDVVTSESTTTENVQEIIEEVSEEVQVIEDNNSNLPEIDEEEYTRSIKDQDVSKEQFAKDKSIILQKIKELDDIMKDSDYDAWLNYIAPVSKDFYGKPRKIMTRKGIMISSGLEDFFNEIFINSRKKGIVDEIRYESPTVIKAVEKTGPNSVSVYYNFQKVDDDWFVVLPTDIALK